MAAPGGCSLTPTGLAEQRARAAFVRPTVRRVDRDAGRLSVEFEPGVDRVALAELVATERACCSFLTLDYDEHRRVLSVAADEADGREVVETFAAFFAVAPSEGSS